VTETVSTRGGEVPPPTPQRVRRPDPEPPPPNAGNPLPTLAFVGAGRAAGALVVASVAAGYRVVAVASRDPVHAADLAGRVGARAVPSAFAAMRAAEITFLTVPDAAVTGVAASVAARGAALRGRGVVHCSASLGVGAVAALRVTAAAVGSLHPLQALAGSGSAPLLRGSLMAIDADPALRTPLHRLVLDLGGLPVALPASARTLYHAAAVLAGNAPPALLATAAELLEAAGLDRRTAEQGLLALMEGAIANTRRAGPRAALTGPLARGDAATVAAHLTALAGRPDVEALYRAVAREIVRLAGTEGREGFLDMLTGHREGGTGLRAERGLGAGGSGYAAEQGEPSASQGARTLEPARSTSSIPPPALTEDPTCP